MLLGLALACGSSSLNSTDRHSTDTPVPTATGCASCSSSPPATSAPASSSAPGASSAPVASSSPPVASSAPPPCSAWTLPSAVSTQWNKCERQPTHDAECAQACATRATAWSCPDQTFYDVTCFAQGDHHCCADMKCILNDTGLGDYCHDTEGTYFCYRGKNDTEEIVPMPADMGCWWSPNQANCCPFKGP